MKSGYRPLGELIKLIDERNSHLVTTRLLGINIDKFFMPSVANVIGTDLSRYKLLRKGLFACNPMHVGRDERLPVALFQEEQPAIVSPAYFMFEVLDSGILDEEYLMLWFRRAEFDRKCWFHTDGSVRGGLTWDDFCRMQVRVPDLEEQKKIVHAYKVIEDRINLKKRINENLTEQIVLLYKQRFPLSENPSLNATISDYCDKIYSGGTPLTTEETFWGGKYNWLSSGETSQDYIISTEKTITDDGINNSTTKLAEKGTVVIASAGQGITRGQTSLLFIDTYINQSLIALKPKKNLLGILYSNLKGRYDEMRNLSDLDSIRGSLTTKSISSLPIYLPDMKLAYMFDSQCKVLFKKIHANIQEISVLNELSHSICASLLI